MRHFSKISFFFSITFIFALSQYQDEWSKPKQFYYSELYHNSRKIDYSDLAICKQPDRIWDELMPLNYLGPSITSSHQKDLTLCPGDAFGDLKKTYVVIKNCFLEMYHQNRMIWSSIKVRLNRDCAFLLEQDGNLRLFSWVPHQPNQKIEQEDFKIMWTSRTELNPLKTELRVQDQQFQILQTFQDETQRLFALSETHPNLREYLGKLKKIGGSGLVKSHTDEIPVILGSHEYIGDLDGLHLILLNDCELHLRNQNQNIWSFDAPYSDPRECSLVIQEEKWISLSNMRAKLASKSPKKKTEYFSSLMIYHSFKVLESQFILKNNQLLIIQTLEDGSKLIFESQQNHNTGLRMQRELRKVGEKNITLTKNEKKFVMQRMDYLGNLTGIHLILQENCTLLYANGSEKLWQSKNSEAPDSFMECYLEFFSKSHAEFQWKFSHTSTSSANIGIYAFYTSRQQLLLDNNYLILTVDYDDKNISKRCYAGPNTHGDWSQQIAESSLKLHVPEHTDFSIHFIANNVHVGDLNGFYYTFEDACNLALFNGSQLLWKSGTAESCVLDFKIDGTLIVAYEKLISHSKLLKEVVTSEISVHDDWLWLTLTSRDGNVQKFKALEGTNYFTKVEISNNINIDL